jgi:two-component system nitrogen regulation sensor histidine kinase NtrY
MAQQQIKRRRIRYVILICLILIPILTYFETVVFQVGEVEFPVSGNVLVFSLININIILLLLMVFLVLRNLLRLVFEQKQFALGKSLRNRLVISFISLSLIPTILLFFIALQFVSTSMDYWFNSNVEASLDESLKVAQDIYQENRERAVATVNNIAQHLQSIELQQHDSQSMQRLLEGYLSSLMPGIRISMS